MYPSSVRALLTAFTDLETKFLQSYLAFFRRKIFKYLGLSSKLFKKLPAVFPDRSNVFYNEVWREFFLTSSGLALLRIANVQ